MICTRIVLSALGLAAASAAQSVQVSIGVRETGFAGGAFTNIGDNGGATGGIEWVNLDAQALTLDGTWQQFTFNLTTDPITAFAGASANSILEGAFGTLEHVRILNNNGITGPFTIFIDDVTNSITGSSTTFGDFQNRAHGAEVMFQEPNFSGSTSANVLLGGTSGIDNFVASRSASNRFAFQFIDGLATRWVRLTTFNTPNQPNPLVRFDQGSVITFWMRGCRCEENVGAQGPGTAVAEMCGTGLMSGQFSIYYAGGAPAGTIGAIAISQPGFPDLPLLGGTWVSGTGSIVATTVFADGSGRFSFPVPGTIAVFDLMGQSAFLDPSLPQSVAFSNAIRMRFGQ